MARSFKVPKDLFKPRRPYEIRGPLNKVELARTQKALGVKLPAALVAVLKVRNGGTLLRTTFTMERQSPRRFVWIGRPSREYHISRLAGIDRSHTDGLTQLAETARAWGVDEGLIAFDGDGHWWACLDYRDRGPRGEPAITHWEQGDPGKPGRTHRVAGSFAELLAGLRRASDDHEPAAIALDHAKVRGKHLAGILKKLGCKKHRYKGAPLPPTWHWHKFRSFVSGLPVWLTVGKNQTYGYAAKHDQRPVGHPILHVSVRLKDEPKCLDELMAALGEKATLLRGVT